MIIIIKELTNWSKYLKRLHNKIIVQQFKFMIFNSFQFLVIFPFVFLLYYVIPARYFKARNVFLLVVSYLLYINWKPAYALILLGVTAITYFCARSFEVVIKRKVVLLGGGTFYIVATSCIQIL